MKKIGGIMDAKYTDMVSHWSVEKVNAAIKRLPSKKKDEVLRRLIYSPTVTCLQLSQEYLAEYLLDLKENKGE